MNDTLWKPLTAFAILLAVVVARLATYAPGDAGEFDTAVRAHMDAELCKITRDCDSYR